MDVSQVAGPSGTSNSFTNQMITSGTPGVFFSVINQTHDSDDDFEVTLPVLEDDLITAIGEDLQDLYHVNGRSPTVSSALRQPSANVTIPLAPIDWKNVIQKCAEAVLTVPNSGILHNDIKDNNVVLHLQDGQYSPVLIDFGKACLITQGSKLRLNSKEREQWKVRYRNLAPELVDGKEAASTATDVHSFGHFVRCISRMTHKQSKLFKEIYLVCMNSSDKRASLSLVLKVLTGKIKKCCAIRSIVSHV
ncbi:uncharacterized protein [Apostichopus japonicus]|uniref:uncharacterized protein n=1 Tax=Stichopus japonicus TaxID=307972 RepID=UPI003AB2CACE